MRPSWFSLLSAAAKSSHVTLRCCGPVCVCLVGWLVGAHREALLWAAICNTIRESQSPSFIIRDTHTREEKSSHCALLPFSLQQLLLGARQRRLLFVLFHLIILKKKKKKKRRWWFGFIVSTSFETRRALKPVQLLFKISLSLFTMIVVSSSHAVTATLEQRRRRGRPFLSVVSFDRRFCLGSNAVKVWNDEKVAHLKDPNKFAYENGLFFKKNESSAFNCWDCPLSRRWLQSYIRWYAYTFLSSLERGKR